MVTQQVREVGRERVADATVLGFGDQPATQLQPEELTWIEHVPVVAIAPPVQPVGFVSGQNLLVRDETGGGLSPPLHSVSHASNVLGVGFLEETALVTRFPLRVVVLDGEKAVLKGVSGFSGVDVGVAAVGAGTTSPACGSGLGQAGSTCRAISRACAVVDLVEIAASRTDQDILRMTPILGEKVAREEIEGHPAGFAVEQLDPQKGLHGYVGVAVAGAGCPVIFTDLCPQASDESRGCPFIGRNVKVLDLLADDPRRHRVYIEALHGASEAVRLDQRRPAPHERVRDADARQVI